MTPKARRLRNWASLAVVALILLVGLDFFNMGFFPGMFNHPRDRWGESALAVMRAADSIEVIRMKQPPTMPSNYANLPLYGMVSAGDPIGPRDDWTARMREAVDNSWNYRWTSHSACLPRPGVCVRFRRGLEVVDLLFCFDCSLVSLAPPDKHGGRIENQWIDFRVNRTPFAELVKELFPNDAAIQAIGK